MIAFQRFLVVVVHQRKVELHTSSHLTPIEVGRSAVSARPALFRGRLMALKKCASGVAWSKGRQNLESMLLTLYEKQYFTPVLACSNLVKFFYTCSDLFRPVHTCSHLFTPVHSYSHLSDFPRSSHNGSFSLNFPLAKSVIFRSYVLSC